MVKNWQFSLLPFVFVSMLLKSLVEIEIEIESRLYYIDMYDDDYTTEYRVIFYFLFVKNIE